MVSPMTPKNSRSKIQRGSPSGWTPQRGQYRPQPLMSSRGSPPSEGEKWQPSHGTQQRSKRQHKRHRSSGDSSSPSNFAGSKCFEPPTPETLPRPPKDWVVNKDSNGVKPKMLVFTPQEFFNQSPLIQA